MVDDFERRTLIRYLLNLADRLHERDGWVSELARLIQNEGRGLGLVSPRIKLRLDPRDLPLNGRSYLQSYKQMLRARLQALRNCDLSLCEANLRRLGVLLALDRAEVSVLGALVRSRASPLWQSALRWLTVGDFSLGSRPFIDLFSKTLALSEDDLHRLLGPASRLSACGLITWDTAGDLRPVRKVLWLCSRRFSSEDEMREFLVGPLAPPRLCRDDFAHVASELSFAVSLLEGAIERNRAGVHVLVYGPVGTGKTEFCKTVAALAGIPLLIVGERDCEDFEPTRAERLSAYLINQNLVKQAPPAAILFDEIEDLFADLTGPLPFAIQRPGSKVFINRVLEQSPIPTFWTANDLSAIGPAALRRMTYAVELKNPPAAARMRLWRRELERHGVAVDDAAVADLARRFTVSPALIENAVRTAAVVGSGEEAVRRTVASVSKLLGLSRLAGTCRLDVDFDPALVQADVDLASVGTRLAAQGATRRFSLCLSGPPGSGKSAYVRALADELDIDLVQKRASDLLAPYVGDTERNIAAAFEEAATSGALLCFDEADSLLLDRRSAVRSWEITEVNEMLTWMETHPLPFVCTTNLPERFDGAALRRFTIRIKFDYLSAAQTELAFRRFFGMEPPPAVHELSNLTAGDFALVAERAALLGATDPVALQHMLEEEAFSKPHAPAFRPGFLRSRLS